MTQHLERMNEFGITGLYEVGGHVRDQLMNIQSNDVDYAVECAGFDIMQAWVAATHKSVFLVKPEFLTIRALTHDNKPHDYVMCRKDGAYSDARRPDTVEPGTIYDDLARRDFTINAMAKCAVTGKLLDPHNGLDDLRNQRITCVGIADHRFNEDTLRILRAIRFAVTKRFTPDESIRRVLAGADGQLLHWVERMNDLPVDRRRDELTKCFAANTLRTMTFFNVFVNTLLRDAMFGTIWLKPTTADR